VAEPNTGAKTGAHTFDLQIDFTLATFLALPLINSNVFLNLL